MRKITGLVVKTGKDTFRLYDGYSRKWIGPSYSGITAFRRSLDFAKSYAEWTSHLVRVCVKVGGEYVSFLEF